MANTRIMKSPERGAGEWEGRGIVGISDTA